MRDEPIGERGAEALALAARGLQAATGEAFFRSLVEHLARQVSADIVLVAELVPSDRVRTLAMWSRGAIAPGVEYELAGTPCEGVTRCATCAWSSDLQALFPGDAMLRDVGAHAYAGTPLLGADGKVLGLLAALWGAPQAGLAPATSLLEIFSARASAELERQRAERALRESEARLELAMWASDLATWDYDVATGTNAVNDRWFAMLGHRRGEIEATQRSWLERIHPDDVGRVTGVGEACLSGSGEYDVTHRIRHADGTWRWIQSRGRVVRDGAGRPVRMVGVNRDVTDQRRLEEELLEARKLEAIGRLAGGVAHDFNNLLTAMLTAIDFAADAIGPGSAAREDLALAKEAAQRASELTRQLLAFARRQHVNPRTIDPNEHVRETERLLRRTLGEDVRLVTALASEPWPVRVDPTQLQQVLVNLAMNARDAMPRGGVLTIETANVRVDEASRHPGLAPGEYVRICVADTGDGMDPETLAHVFEPFFTTKQGGRGTGLGLATVYGIVTQAGGHVVAQSELGAGSTFKLWLPRGEGKVASLSTCPHESEPRGGTETVLLVEDDPLVLATAARALRSAGYEVIGVRSGDEALAQVRAHEVDILVTDVVMPRMPGTAVAREVDRLRPGIPILFISGYTAGAALGVVLRDRGDAFLPKPFTTRALVAKVREVLDRYGRPAAGRPGPVAPGAPAAK